MKEMKRTEYTHLNAGIFASRDYLCINEKLKYLSNTDKSHVCQSLLSDQKKKTDEEKGCAYYENVLSGVAHLDTIADIEDLCKIGSQENACAYYMAKKKLSNADIIFMPYNYLFDPKIRNIDQLKLRNAIIIIDEAHNVESVCENSACTKITTTKIATAVQDITYVSLIFFL